MYYLFGSSACVDVLRDVAHAHLAPGADTGCFYTLKAAYQTFLRRWHPRLPSGSVSGPVYVDDPRIESELIRAFLNESPLDDLPRYRDKTFFEIGDERRGDITADLLHVANAIDGFRDIDPGFWNVFDLFVNHLFFAFSRYSRGGTDSDCIGVLYLSRARQYSLRDLYEIIVHELTHTMMFVDELTRPHYGEESLMPHPENWALAAITGMRRPLDKVLHSMVISTEVLLHRELVLGHEGETTIHPDSVTLRGNVLRTIDSLVEHPNRDALLGRRGFELIARCHDTITALRGASGA